MAGLTASSGDDKTADFYMPFAAFPNDEYMFATGDGQYKCVVRGEDLLAVNDSIEAADAANVQIQLSHGDGMLGAGAFTNNLHRSNVAADPMFGCGGTRAQNVGGGGGVRLRRGRREGPTLPRVHAADSSRTAPKLRSAS